MSLDPVAHVTEAAGADSALLGLAVIDALMATRLLAGPARPAPGVSIEPIARDLAAAFTAADISRAAGDLVPRSLLDYLA